VRPIESVGTSTAAFVGEAARGIPGRATFLTSPRDYERRFGGQRTGDLGYLAQAVEAFFRAGGTRCYVVRALPASAIAATGGGVATRQTPFQPPAPNPGDPLPPLQLAPPALSLTAKGRGVWGNGLRVSIAADPINAAESFRLQVSLVEDGVTRLVEDFQDLRMDPAAERYFADVIERESQYINVVDEFAAWKDAGAGPIGGTAVTPIAATPPTLVSGAIAALAIHEGATLSFSWKDDTQSAAATTVTVTFDATTLAAANVALAAAAQPTIPAFANGRTTVTSAGMLVAWLAAAAPSLTATVDGTAVRIVAPFNRNVGTPGFVESFDTTWISVFEPARAGVGRVLDGFGFGRSKASGYEQNHPANPLARPVVSAAPLRFSAGTDGSGRPASADFIGTTVDGSGLHALDRVDVNLVAIPGQNDVDTLTGAIAWCDARQDCFFIADGPGSPSRQFEMTAAEARAYIDALPVRSNNAAMYFPWPQEPDPVGVGRNPRRFVPPSGLVAGILARTDRQRGVWKAPAGIEAVVNGVVGTQVNVADADQDLLNPVGLNCIRAIQGAGIVVWGARTLASDPEWRYVPVRRTALFLKESIRRGMQWAVFEPNDEDLWRQIQLNISAFMLGLFRQGAFQGSTPDEAFLVQCDRETNPQELVDQGIVTARVQFAPLKPAEFVVIEISQKSLVGAS
jgi:phage tail sheath protein FI